MCTNNYDTLDPWTYEEEVKLILAYKTYKNHWAKVARAIKGRTGNMAKNKFYSIFRKVKTKIHKNDFNYTNKLELFEMHYITNLLAKYLENPITFVKQKGRRGKDYILSLIPKMSKYSVDDYKRNLVEKTKSQGTVESLFDELTKEYKTTLPGLELKEKEKRRKPKRIKLSKEEPVKEDNPKAPSVACTNYLAKMKKEVQPIPSNCTTQHWENSPLFDFNQGSPPFIFSPPCLSAGPAAAAASASNAACFNFHPCPSDGFTELSNCVKTFQVPQTFNRTASNNMLVCYPRTPQIICIPHDGRSANSAFQSVHPQYQMIFPIGRYGGSPASI